MAAPTGIQGGVDHACDKPRLMQAEATGNAAALARNVCMSICLLSHQTSVQGVVYEWAVRNQVIFVCGSPLCHAVHFNPWGSVLYDTVRWSQQHEVTVSITWEHRLPMLHNKLQSWSQHGHCRHKGVAANTTCTILVFFCVDQPSCAATAQSHEPHASASTHIRTCDAATNASRRRYSSRSSVLPVQGQSALPVHPSH